MTKKVLCILMTVALLLSVAACGNSTATTSVEEAVVSEEETAEEAAPTEETEPVAIEEAAETESAAVEEETASADEVEEPADEPAEEIAVINYPIEAENLELSMVFSLPGDVGNRYTDFNEHIIFQEAEARTGVHLTFISTGGMRDSEALTLWAASGDMPDLISNASSNYPGGAEVAVAEEILLDISEYLEYAPNFDAYRTRTEQDELDSMTDSGYIVDISSYFVEDIGPTTGPMIRQDWLDELSLDTPVTYDDWETVLLAFRDNYDCSAAFMFPNTLTAQNNYFASGFDTMGFTVNAGGRVTDPFYQIEGEAKFALLEDTFLDYMTLLNKWYSEGLISQDFVTYDTDANRGNLTSYVTTDMTGIWFSDQSMMQTYADQAQDSDFRCVAITDPVQEEGQTTHFDSDRTGLTTYSIAASCDNPEVAMMWFNYWYTDEGILLANYGIEGESYEMVDGEPQYTDLMTANPDGETFKTCQLLYAMLQIPTVVDSTASYVVYSDDQIEATSIWSSNIDNAYVMPDITMTEEESNEYGSLYSDLSTLVSENLIKFIIGDRDLAEWDSFVSDLKDMNAERCVELYQSALNRYYER